jgi:hypothetical protein
MYKNYIELITVNRTTFGVLFKQNHKYLGFIYREIDGDFVFKPFADKGHWSQLYLLAIGETLQELNGQIITTDRGANANRSSERSSLTERYNKGKQENETDF